MFFRQGNVHTCLCKSGGVFCVLHVLAGHTFIHLLPSQKSRGQQRMPCSQGMLRHGCPSSHVLHCVCSIKYRQFHVATCLHSTFFPQFVKDLLILSFWSQGHCQAPGGCAINVCKINVIHIRKNQFW